MPPISLCSVSNKNGHILDVAELRGAELLAADLKIFENYGNHIQDLVRSFQVPLQNDYDRDQVEAYYRCCPHVVFARLIEVYSVLLMAYGEQDQKFKMSVLILVDFCFLINTVSPLVLNVIICPS